MRQDSDSLNSSPEHAAYAQVQKKQPPPTLNVAKPNMESVSSASVSQLETVVMPASPTKEVTTGGALPGTGSLRRRSVSSKIDKMVLEINDVLFFSFDKEF